MMDTMIAEDGSVWACGYDWEPADNETRERLDLEDSQFDLAGIIDL